MSEGSQNSEQRASNSSHISNKSLHVIPCESYAVVARPSGNTPRGRDSHTCVLFEGCIYSFGGAIADEADVRTPLADLWCFDLQSQQWTELQRKAGQLWPPRREGHSAVRFKRSMVIFGGQDGEQKYVETYVFSFDDKQWRVLDDCNQLSATVDLFTQSSRVGSFGTDASLSTSPSSHDLLVKERTFHSACVFQDQMYIFGGLEGGDDHCSNDFFSLDFVDHRWRVEAGTGQRPTARYEHSAVAYADQMYIYGGCSDNDQPLFDLHEYNFNSKDWRTVEVRGGVPPRPCHGHTSCVDYDTNCMLCYGGTAFTEEGDEEITDAIHVFTLDDRTWYSVNIVDSTDFDDTATSIPPCHGHGSVYWQGSLYTHGGYGEQYHDHVNRIVIDRDWLDSRKDTTGCVVQPTHPVLSNQPSRDSIEEEEDALQDDAIDDSTDQDEEDYLPLPGYRQRRLFQFKGQQQQEPEVDDQSSGEYRLSVNNLAESQRSGYQLTAQKSFDSLAAVDSQQLDTSQASMETLGSEQLDFSTVANEEMGTRSKTRRQKGVGGTTGCSNRLLAQQQQQQQGFTQQRGGSHDISTATSSNHHQGTAGSPTTTTVGGGAVFHNYDNIMSATEFTAFRSEMPHTLSVCSSSSNGNSNHNNFESPNNSNESAYDSSMYNSVNIDPQLLQGIVTSQHEDQQQHMATHITNNTNLQTKSHMSIDTQPQAAYPPHMGAVPHGYHQQQQHLPSSSMLPPHTPPTDNISNPLFTTTSGSTLTTPIPTTAHLNNMHVHYHQQGSNSSALLSTAGHPYQPYTIGGQQQHQHLLLPQPQQPQPQQVPVDTTSECMCPSCVSIRCQQPTTTATVSLLPSTSGTNGNNRDLCQYCQQHTAVHTLGGASTTVHHSGDHTTKRPHPHAHPHYYIPHTPLHNNQQPSAVAPSSSTLRGGGCSQAAGVVYGCPCAMCRAATVTTTPDSQSLIVLQQLTDVQQNLQELENTMQRTHEMQQTHIAHQYNHYHTLLNHITHSFILPQQQIIQQLTATVVQLQHTVSNLIQNNTTAAVTAAHSGGSSIGMDQQPNNTVWH